MGNLIHATFGDPDRAHLIESHLPLVSSIVGRLWAKGPIAGVEPDDLFSEGAIGLISAADTFDAGRGNAFSTWATIKIRSAVCGAIRRQRRQNGREESAVGADARADLLADADLRDLDAEIVLHEGLLLLHRSDDRLCRILELLYLREKTKVEIAVILDISPPHVERLHQEALDFLRLHFAQAA